MSGKTEARAGKTPRLKCSNARGFPEAEGPLLVKEVEGDIWESGPLVLTNVGGDDEQINLMCKGKELIESALFQTVLLRTLERDVSSPAKMKTKGRRPCHSR